MSADDDTSGACVDGKPSEAELWRELNSKRAIFADTLGYLADSNLPEDDRVNAVFCMLRDSFSVLQESIEKVRPPLSS